MLVSVSAKFNFSTISISSKTTRVCGAYVHYEYPDKDLSARKYRIFGYILNFN